MGIRMYMAKKWERTTYADNNRNYKGNIYDYKLEVKYYPKVYFRSNCQSDIEEWLCTHFDIGYHFNIPDYDDSTATREIGKGAFEEVFADKRLFADAVIDAVKNYGFAEGEREVKEFITDAIRSKSNDDKVFIEFW